MNSVGSKGDPFDNALAESINGLYKSELITLQGPWRIVDDVELATPAWVDWWNTRRLHSAIGNIPPAEFEALYASQSPATNPGGIKGAGKTEPKVANLELVNTK